MKTDWKRRLIILTILLGSYPTFSQVILLKKNNLFPYDSGVAMPIYTYRYWRLKTIKSDSLIQSKSNLINLLEKKTVELELKQSLSDSINYSFSLEIKNKNITIDSLHQSNKVVIDECVEKTTSNNKNKKLLIIMYSSISFMLGLLIGI